jgi:hypothetical protein
MGSTISQVLCAPAIQRAFPGLELNSMNSGWEVGWAFYVSREREDSEDESRKGRISTLEKLSV